MPFDLSLIFGQEAIDFQLSSSLKKKMVDVFQMGIDFRDNLDYSRVPADEASRRKYRIREVYNYFLNVISPKFIQVVKEEIGFNIRKLYCFGGPDYDVYGYFAVGLTMAADECVAEIVDAMSGTGNYQYTHDREAVEDARRMYQAWDRKTGKISKIKRKGKLTPVTVDMYFDVNCAYLIHDFLPMNSSQNLTAGEIAAIMLHECGHVNSVIEHSGDLFVTYNQLTNYIRDMKFQQDPQKLVDSLRAALPSLDEISKTKLPDTGATKFVKATAEMLSTAITNVTKTYDEDPGSENFFYTIGNLTFNVLYMVFFALWYVYINLLIYVLGIGLLYEIARLAYVDTNSDFNKASDFGSNFNNLFTLERWADEYVTRLGLGAELASGLNKLVGEFMKNMQGSVSSSTLRHSTIFGCMCKVYSWFLDKISILHYLEPLGYENQYNRIVRMRENVLTFFKKRDIPGPMADLWINSVMQLDAEAKKAKTMSDTAVGKAFYAFLRNLLSPAQWVMNIKNGNLDGDLRKMQDMLDRMINNRLFMQSYQLKNLR